MPSNSEFWLNRSLLFAALLIGVAVFITVADTSYELRRLRIMLRPRLLPSPTDQVGIETADLGGTQKTAPAADTSRAAVIEPLWPGPAA